MSCVFFLGIAPLVQSMFDLFPNLPPKADSDGSESDSDLSVTTSGISTEPESLLLEGGDHDDRLEPVVDETSDLLELVRPAVWLGVIVLEELSAQSPVTPGLLIITPDDSGVT